MFNDAISNLVFSIYFAHQNPNLTKYPIPLFFSGGVYKLRIALPCKCLALSKI